MASLSSVRLTRCGTAATVAVYILYRWRKYAASARRSVIIASWRRYRATASRNDRRIAQVSGILASEVLERRVGPGEVGVLWGER